MANEIEDKFKDILENTKDKSIEEVKKAGQDLIRMGRDAFVDWVSDTKDLIKSADAQAIADMYVQAEAAALNGQTALSERIITRLNLTVTSYGAIEASRLAYRAKSIWSNVLNTLVKLGSSVLKIFGGGVGAAIGAGAEMIVDMANKGAAAAEDKLKG